MPSWTTLASSPFAAEVYLTVLPLSLRVNKGYACADTHQIVRHICSNAARGHGAGALIANADGHLAVI